MYLPDTMNYVESNEKYSRWEKGVKRGTSRSIHIAKYDKIYLPIYPLERYFSDKTSFCTAIRCFVNIILIIRHFDPF